MSLAALALSTLVLAATAAQPNAVIQKNFGRLRVSMVAEEAGPWTSSEHPSQWLARARRVVLESRRGSDVTRFEIVADGTSQRISWQVGGAERAFDAAARQWRDQMLATLDTTWEIARLRGEVNGLSGEIASIRGQESSLRGEIVSLRGDVSSMHERRTSIRRDESNLRKELDAVRARPAALREAIWVARSNISALEMGGSRPDAFQAPIERYQNEIARLERELKESDSHGKEDPIYRRIRALDADRQVAAIEAEIARFDLDGKVAAIEKRIAALDVDGQTRVLQTQIDALDADRRVRQLEARRKEELKRLTSAISSIR
jgi:chromosome segregation ATPase